LQSSHNQEGVRETSSTFENENLCLNEYSLEIIFIDQLTYTFFFHEDDRVVMFDNLE